MSECVSKGMTEQTNQRWMRRTCLTKGHILECEVERKGHPGELCTGTGSKGGKAATGSARNKLWAALTVK